MKIKFLNKKSFISALSFITLLSCSTTNTEDEINEKIELAGVNSAALIDLGVGDDSLFETYSETRESETLSTSESFEDYGTKRLICTTEKVSVQDGTSNFQLFGGLSSDVIYPGNLLQGASVVDLSIATPSIIPLDRAEGTISININGGVDTPSVTVDEVKTSTIQTAINEIINSASAAVPANFELDIIQVETEKQLALEMGLSFEGWGAKASTDLSFSTDKSYNRTLVKLKQTFYTINFDTPTKVEDIFADHVTFDDYEPYISADNPATFISSVAYGRIFYMLVESTSSRLEMQSNLSFAYGGLSASGGGSVEVSAFDSLSDLKIKIIAFGGDAAGAIALAGETSVNEIANKLAESTDIQTALPLSYKVRSVYDPATVVGVKLATEYDVVTCEIKGVLPPAAYLGLVDLFEDGIGAVVQITGSTVLLYNTKGNKYAFYDGATAMVLSDSSNNTVFEHNDPDGPLGESLLETVGAAYFVHYYDRDRLRFFDKTGLLMMAMNFNGDEFTSGTSLPQSITANYSIKETTTSEYFKNYFSGTFLIPGYGIEAAYFASQTGNYPSDDYHYLVDNGSLMARTKDRVNGGKRVWLDVVTPSGRSFLLDNIGAAGTVTLGGTRQRIFFDMTGKNMFISNADGEKLGPFVVN